MARGRLKYIFFSLRPEQWVKNTLIFIPLIFGKKLFIFPDNLKSVAAFMVFSAVAGAAYLVNDILDIEKDARHPVKSLRPVVSGKLDAGTARIAALVSGILSVAASFGLSRSFGAVMICYLAMNLVYTRFLKEIFFIDVLCLGVFFSFRIIAGSLLLGVAVSRWVIIMTFLLALFLGFNKRRQEAKLPESNSARSRKVLSNYSVYPVDWLIGAISFLVVISYFLYTVDAVTVEDFGSKRLVYSVPFVIFGIWRYLYLTRKFDKGEDPSRILLSDTLMKIDLISWIVVCIAVIYAQH